MSLASLPWQAGRISALPLRVRLAGAAAALALVAWLSWYTADFRLDDALIYARYARNLVDGHGLVFNEGEKRNALSSYLYVWIIAIPGFLGLDIPRAANIIGALSSAGAVLLLIFAVFPRDDLRWAAAGVLSGIVYASCGLLYQSFGMETPVALFFAVAFIAAYVNRHLALAAVFAGLALVTRVELVLLVGPVYAAILWQDRKVRWRDFAIIAAIVAPFIVFTWAYYGSPLPVTLGAKRDQAASGFWGPDPVFWHTAETVMDQFYIGLGAVIVLAAIAFAVIAIYLVVRWLDVIDYLDREPPRELLVSAGGLLVYGAGLFAFYLAADVPAYTWYLLPLVLVLAVSVPLATVLGVEVVRSFQPKAETMAIVMAVVFPGALLALQFSNLQDVPTEPNEPYKQIAAYVDAHSGPEDGSCTLGAAEVGHLGWYTHCRIIDLVGLTTEGNSALLREHNFDAWIERYRPEYIVSFVPLAPYDEGVVHHLFDGTYAIAEDLAVAGKRLYRSTGETPSGSGSLLGTDIGNGSATLNEGLYTVGAFPRPALFMHVTQQYTFEVPAGSVFHAWLGIADGAERSDGVTFIVWAAQGTEADKELARVVVKPGAWHELEVPLPEGEGDIDLTIGTDIAPGGTTDFGWALWGEPKVRTR